MKEASSSSGSSGTTSSAASNEPIFIKGDFRFTIEQVNMTYRDRNISLFGVTGLPWESPLSPESHFGSQISVDIHIPKPKPAGIVTKAFITREHTAAGELMGLRFHLEPRQKTLLGDLITHYGFFPPEYARKYPRIPATHSIQTYPLRVISKLSGVRTHFDNAPMVLDVRNLSLGGILLSTENQMAVAIIPGNTLDIYVEPRGDFSVPVSVQGKVCWTMDEISIENGNLIRYLGIRFTYLNEENKTIFLELVKDILLKIRSKPA